MSSLATSTTATNAADNDDDTWVDPDSPSDVSGPVILVLPTQPPTCLASDAHGDIFASPLENMVDDNPVTAEPHDVRQVWVVNRVAGLREGEVSFKGSHGGYLSCDETGVLGARREARGVEEGFTVEVIPAGERVGGESSSKGEWRVKTAAASRSKDPPGGKYLAAVVDREGEESGRGGQKKVSVALRGDGRIEEESTRLILRMQARFKPKLQRDKEQKKSEKISRAELERTVGRRLEKDEVRRLKRAKRDGTYHEEILDVRVKGKHDKFA